MKVRISYVVEVDTGTRRAMAHYYGDRRLATWKEVQQWFEMYGHTMNDTLSDEHGVCCMGVAPKEA